MALLWIGFGLCFVLQCVSTPVFLKLSWPNRTIKSHVAKMVCATLFVLVGYLSVKIADNTSGFANTMILGLLLGWVGDLFLHFDKQSLWAVGFISFMAGHIAYIKAYITALNEYVGYNQFNVYEIILGVILVCVAFVVAKRFKVEFSMKILKFGIILYTVILIIMFIKASALGLNFMLSGGKYGVLAFVVLCIGALMFMLSDGTIGLLMFGGQKKNRPLKIFNIVSYFLGQMLLASSILFIKI